MKPENNQDSHAYSLSIHPTSPKGEGGISQKIKHFLMGFDSYKETKMTDMLKDRLTDINSNPKTSCLGQKWMEICVSDVSPLLLKRKETYQTHIPTARHLFHYHKENIRFFKL